MDKFAWIDAHGIEYRMDDIDNEYLINILGFVCRGGGYAHVVTVENVINLFRESYKRGLNHSNSLSDAILNKQ